MSNTYSECVSSLKCLARIALALYCHLWPVWLYNISPYYLIKGTIFRKTLLNTKRVCLLACLFVFSVTFRILRRIQRDVIISLSAPEFSLKF